MLAPQFWKQGYAYEACKSLISILWRDYNITEIIAEVDTRNLASFKLLERLGFIRIETRENADFFKTHNTHLQFIIPLVQSNKYSQHGLRKIKSMSPTFLCNMQLRCFLKTRRFKREFQS